jgi:hypothetical protein
LVVRSSQTSSGTSDWFKARAVSRTENGADETRRRRLFHEHLGKKGSRLGELKMEKMERRIENGGKGNSLIGDEQQDDDELLLASSPD